MAQNASELMRRYFKQVKAPTKYTKVYKAECAYTFTTPEFAGGLYLNMKSFYSVCEEFLEKDHQKSGNGIYLHSKWTRVYKEKTPEELEAEKNKPKPTKLAIGVDGGFDASGDTDWEYKKDYQLVVMPERVVVPYPSDDIPDAIALAAKAIIDHVDTNEEQKVNAWEDEVKPTKFAESLIQLDNGVKISPNPADWKCAHCDNRTNLWLNLSDGYIGGGRELHGGKGGCGEALRHFKATGSKYPLAVKLGTITPHSADVYSYDPSENDMVEDPLLAKHLSHWGINMMSMEKTEKTMTELNIDLNLKFEWDAMTESGKDLEKISGPGHVGLKNTGNSCYLNSVIQVLFSLPEFKARYYDNASALFANAQSNPVLDFNAQMAKLGVALYSDRYDPTKSKDVPEHFGVAPSMLRAVVGANHVEFSGRNQQDAHEYYQYLLDFIAKDEKRNKLKPNLPSLFEFELEERLEDLQSHNVKYTKQKNNTLELPIPVEAATNAAEIAAWKAKQAEHADKKVKTDEKEREPPAQVPFDKCLEAFSSDEVIDGFLSPVTQKRGQAAKHPRFSSFPPYLMVKLRRYVLAADWTPKKLNAEVTMPQELDLEHLRSKGKQDNETLLPESTGAKKQAIEPDAGLVAQLTAMGFGENGCKRACIAVQNANADAAMNWILAHMGDPDFNDPLPAGGAAAGGAGDDVDAASVQTIVGMGFTPNHAKQALKATGGDMARAMDWIFSHPEQEASADDSKEQGPLDGAGKYELLAIISHMGPNTGSGHYVCHIKKGGKWIIFNDRKVCISESPPFALGFMFLYARKDNKQ